MAEEERTRNICVLENIYCSSLANSEKHWEETRTCGFTHLLCLCQKPRWIQKKDIKNITVAYYNTRKHNIANTHWILKFQEINNFLRQGTTANGVWIIGDISLIKFLLAMFLITSKKKMIGESISSLPELRQTPIHDDFFVQLQLWEAMGCTIDEDNASWILYKQQKWPTDRKHSIPAFKSGMLLINSESRMRHEQENFNNNKLNPFTLPSVGDSNWGYCCNTCGIRLFTSTNIYHHNPNTKYQPMLNKRYPCKTIVIEPLRWMVDIDKRERGEICCYSCTTKIGTWSWHSETCSDCQNEISPAFVLLLSELIFIPPSSPKLEKKSKRRSSAGNIIRKFIGDRRKSSFGPTVATYSTIAARNYESLPDVHKKLIMKKMKRTPQEINENWFVFKQAFAFSAKVKIVSHIEDDTEDSLTLPPKTKKRRNHLSYLPVTLEGITLLTKGTEFEDRIPALLAQAEQTNIKRVLDHPIVAAYLQYVIGPWKPCNIPFIDTSLPNYKDLATETLLNTKNPCEMFKVDKSKEGTGGYGKVYLAKHLETGTKMVIKKMEHATPNEIIRNYKEVAIMATCTHPNIVKYFDCYQMEKELWIAMEYIAGGTLEDLRCLNVPFDEHQIAYIARESLRGLKYLHDLGLVHRDIKPVNIMVTAYCEVKLIDFGMTDSLQAIVERPKIVGSAGWVSPEMILHAPATIQSDIFSLGAALLLLFDCNAFKLGGKLQTLFTVALAGRADFYLNCRRKISSHLKRFLMAMLHRLPEERLTIDDLLVHPFLKNKKISKDSLVPLVNQLMSTRTAYQS